MHSLQERNLMTKEQILDELCAILGGRVAEHLTFGRITTGASDDLEKVTNIAYSQLQALGMDKEIGLLAFDNYSTIKPFSDAFAFKIDKRAREIINTAFARTEVMLKEKKDLLEKLAQELLKKENLNKDDLIRILGPRPWPDKMLDWFKKEKEKLEKNWLLNLSFQLLKKNQ